MELLFSTIDKVKKDIGIFFVTEELRFSQNICAHDYMQDFTKHLQVNPQFKGKTGEVISFIPSSESEFKRIFVFGIGKEKNPSNTQLVGSAIVQSLEAVKAQSAVVCFNVEDDIEDFAYNLYIGMSLRAYKFNRYFVNKQSEHTINLKSVIFCAKDIQKITNSLKHATTLIDSINFTRDLVSEPGNVIYPETLADACKDLEKEFNIKVKVLDKSKLKKLGMNALLGVGQGSINDPYMVTLEWHGNDNSDEIPLAFVGKGVTFDTGGISLKPSQNMADMKYDMAGAAAVIGTIRALAARKAKVNVVGLIGLVENMPSGSAQRPGDVVKSMSGQTIEVDNTDAEGRLVLADVLWYTQQEYKPRYIVDLATLTGALVVALGENLYAGLFTEDEEFAGKLLEAGSKSGDKLWRLPMHKHYDKQINSEIADVKNVGNGRGGGSITAAHFLRRFIKDGCVWAHLDIASMAWDKYGKDVHSKGATGYGVRLLDKLVGLYFE